MHNANSLPNSLLRTFYEVLTNRLIKNDSSSDNLTLRQMSFEAFCKTIQAKPLSGLSGTNWQLFVYNISAHNISVLARQISADRRELGINRTQEATILQQLSHLNIAPKVVSQTEEWLFLEWLDELNRPILTPESFATLAVTVHKQPLSGFQLDLKQRFEQLFAHIDPSRLTTKWQATHEQFLTQDLPASSMTVLAHMDLHEGNLVFTQSGWKLIDWEYAADTDLFLELAALFSGMGWVHNQKVDFLNAYAEECAKYNLQAISEIISDTKSVFNALDAWQPWLNYLSFLWFEVRWQQTKDVLFIAPQHGESIR